MAKSQVSLRQAADSNQAKIPRIKILVNKIQDLPTLPAVAVQALRQQCRRRSACADWLASSSLIQP
jgi:hypothetical protein